MSTGGRGVRPPSRLRFGINPIALAELLHGAPASASDWESMEAFLAKVYDLKAGTAELLEGQAEMPARLALFQTVRDVVRDPRRLDAVMALPQARRLIDLYGEQRVARVLPFLVPIADAVFTPDAVATGPNDRVVGDYRDVDAFDVDAVSYLDPLQGAAADCYLIAPLIAVAWAQSKRWAARIGSAHGVIRGPVVRFGFFGGQRAALAPLQIRLRLPVDRGGNLPFARTARREAAAFDPMA